jgi:hypothetical protein
MTLPLALITPHVQTLSGLLRASMRSNRLRRIVASTRASASRREVYSLASSGNCSSINLGSVLSVGFLRVRGIACAGIACCGYGSGPRLRPVFIVLVGDAQYVFSPVDLLIFASKRGISMQTDSRTETCQAHALIDLAATRAESCGETAIGSPRPAE